jgi:hypothetical protein
VTTASVLLAEGGTTFLDEGSERIRQVEELGATVVCLQNGSGADPLGALRTYGEKVLPALEGARV